MVRKDDEIMTLIELIDEFCKQNSKYEIKEITLDYFVEVIKQRYDCFEWKNVRYVKIILEDGTVISIDYEFIQGWFNEYANELDGIFGDKALDVFCKRLDRLIGQYLEMVVKR